MLVRFFYILGGLFFLIGFVGCSTPTAQKPAMTSLEIQAFQKQSFETTKKIAFAATMSVFQDLGYTIASADFETGFITATSPTATGSTASQELYQVGQVFGMLSIALGGGSCGSSYGGGQAPSVSSKATRATAFIEDITPVETTIRLNFVASTQTSGAYGQTAHRDSPILDPQIYQNAFVKIQEAIFIREGFKKGEIISEESLVDESSSVEG